MTHEKLVEAMSCSHFYPHKPAHVDVIQTHISYIFIADEYVFKVKKAVDFGFLDFTTLEKRKFYCHEELRLNKRLAPAIYLDVVEISENSKGDIVLGTGDNVIEYAVKMRKIPQERMLKNLLKQGEVDPSIMDVIAKKLADFHRKADTGGKIDRIGGIKTIRKNQEENFLQTVSYIDVTIPRYQHSFIKAYAYDFMRRHRDLLAKRVREKKIRDCHGDLHLEHIFIIGESTSKPGTLKAGERFGPDDVVIFDCIEFNERFRYEDVAAEVAFLTMDLDFNGYHDYSDAFVKAYTHHTGDAELNTLLNFYKCYYAYVRGKVVGFRIHDPAISAEGRNEAAATARKYFDLAYTYAARPEKPTLILMAGLMGTGKSVRAKQLAPRVGAHIIQMDTLRKELLNMEPTSRHYEKFGEGIYSNDMTHVTYARALEKAMELIRSGQSVIIDASYRNRLHRLEAYTAAKSLHADFFIIECTCPEDVIKERLEARMSDTKEASDGRWELFQAQKESFHPITEIPSRSHIIINAARSPEECTYEALKKMKSL